MIMLNLDIGSVPQKPHPATIHRNWVAIASMSQNRVIGQSGAIPWHLPEDLHWFKRVTTGHIVVMGRRTFESVGVLPGRQMIVMSRNNQTFKQKTMESTAELESFVAFENRTVFICGGEQIYQQVLPMCGSLLLTTVNKVVEGDAFFPAFDHLFKHLYEIRSTKEFTIDHYIRR